MASQRTRELLNQAQEFVRRAQTPEELQQARQLFEQVKAMGDRERADYVPVPAGPVIPEPEKTSILPALASEAFQGLTLNYGDEIIGGILADPERVREQTEFYSDRAGPIPGAVANVGGMLLNPLSRAVGTYVGGARSLPGALGRGILGGAAEGGVAAAGAGEGDIFDRALQALPGMLLGAAGGAGGAAIGNWLARFLHGSGNNAALRRVQDVLKEGDQVTPQQLQALPSVGVDETIPEKVARARNLPQPKQTSTGGLQRQLVTQPGPGRVETAEALTARVGEPQLQRLVDLDEATFGTAVRQINRDQANALYGAYRAAPFAIGAESGIRRLIKAHPELKKGIQSGRSQYLADNAQRVTSGDLTPDSPEVKWNWDVMHNVKMGLDDQIGKAVRAGTRNKVQRLTKIKRDYLNELETANPAYGQARRFYASEAEIENANKLGREIKKMEPDDVEALLPTMSAPERDNFVSGVTYAIRREMETATGQIPDYANKLLRSNDWMRKLRAISPDADKFIESLKAESRALESYRGATQGSDTAARLSENANEGFWSLLGQGLTGGNLATIVPQAAGRALATATGNPGPYQQRLAAILSETDPQRVRQLLQQLETPIAQPGGMAARVGGALGGEAGIGMPDRVENDMGAFMRGILAGGY